MISDNDRSYYIGASDTKYVMGKWDTNTFREWWQIKQGLLVKELDNIYLTAGNVYEPKILDYMDVTERDRQIIVGRLRVNLDGEYEDSVVEVKTYGYKDVWKPPKAYIQQVQVEMFATCKEKTLLVGYGLLEEDYFAASQNSFHPIDENRITIIPISYDEKWVEEEYLPRLWRLAECLDKEIEPWE